MLFNHYFTMKSNNNLLMYRSSLQIFLSLFPDYSACETASQSNKNIHVLLNQLFKNVLNTFGIVASPFLNIISYLFIMYSNGIALEYQVTKSSGWNTGVLIQANSPTLALKYQQRISLLSLPRYMAEDEGKGRGKSFPVHLNFCRKIRKKYCSCLKYIHFLKLEKSQTSYLL